MLTGNTVPHWNNSLLEFKETEETKPK